MELHELCAHLHAELGVEIGERLVHEEGRRVAHDRAAHRHALPLAARQGSRLALEELVDAEQLGGASDPPSPLVLRDLLHAQREADVVADRHVRVERVVLEHHRDVPIDGVEVVDDPVADQDLARGRLLEARHHAQRRRLAASRRADEDHELPVPDLEVEIVDGDRAVAELLRHAREPDPGHLGGGDARTRPVFELDRGPVAAYRTVSRRPLRRDFMTPPRPGTGR